MNENPVFVGWAVEEGVFDTKERRLKKGRYIKREVYNI